MHLTSATKPDHPPSVGSGNVETEPWLKPKPSRPSCPPTSTAPCAICSSERGFVTYTDEAKHDMLGIPLDLIRRDGAVSKAVAEAMAEGALARSRATLAVSVTGFAGDGAEPGLVHFACARHGRDTLHREEHFGDIGRGEIRLACMRVAVEMLDAML